MAILTKQEQIAEASTTDLVETYNALTGKAIKKFENREIAMRRCEMAMLSAKDADGHTGVPKGSDTQVRTRAEIVDKAESKGVPVPPALDEEEVKFEPGSLADQLSKAAKAAKPITPREKVKPAAGAPKKEAPYAVQATYKGTSTPQAGSVRNNVLLKVQASKHCAITIADLDKHFEQPTRGYVQKLIEKNHLIVLTQEQFAAAKPVAKPATK